MERERLKALTETSVGRANLLAFLFSQELKAYDRIHLDAQ
jgi:hypothetical protein